MNVIITTPIVTEEKFSENTGMTMSAVRGQVARDNLPIFKVGKRRMINLIKYVYGPNGVIDTPVMTPEAFAQRCGLTKNSIETQISLGNLPGKRIGRRTLVDLAELTQQCKTAHSNNSSAA